MSAIDLIDLLLDLRCFDRRRIPGAPSPPQTIYFRRFPAKILDETFACTYAERDPRYLAIVGNTAVTVMFGPRKF